MTDKPPESTASDPTLGLTERSKFLLYTAADGAIHIRVALRNDTIWLPQKDMAQLFGVGVPAISKHLKNIFESSELQEKSVISILETTATDGKRYRKRYYNLDAIIAVGYRVNSFEATQFRIWATRTLREYIVKGFVLDDARLKQGQAAFGKDYFEELLERIREIRASERRFYQKITDIYATASDYDPGSTVSRQFFASVQNKLHWAIAGKTAAEIVHSSADAEAPNMGLKSWKRAPHGKILKSDALVAKNYLDEEQISGLNRVVSAYLDLAENRARRRKTTTMAEWAKFIDQYLELNDYDILEGKGSISAETAKQKVGDEYAVFRKKQDRAFESDFDRFAAKAKKLTK